MKKLRVCALVYVSDGPLGIGSLPNSKAKDVAASYFAQAFSLNRSLIENGMPTLTIYTNKPDVGKKVEARKSRYTAIFHRLEVPEWAPQGIKFKQAHYKIDLLRKLKDTLSDDEGFILLDTDILCLRPLDNEFITRGAAYNISDQTIPAYGFDVIKADLEALCETGIENPCWYGGEFLAGDKPFLSRLLTEIDKVLPLYLKLWPKLHHQGDEAIVSAALNRMGTNTFIDVAPLNIINRFWTIYTKHRQRSLKHCLDGAFLHLPSEKKYIESLAKGKGKIMKYYLLKLGVKGILKFNLSRMKYKVLHPNV